MKKVTILFLILFILNGCNFSNKEAADSTKDVNKIDPICQSKINNLNEVCRSASSDMDIETLANCDWFLNDRDGFLEDCSDFYYYYSNESSFSEKMLELCDNTEFGKLTAKEITICKEVSDHFYFLENYCECN